MPSERDPVLIVGAGLAGLSAAFHLADRPYVLVERELEIGGLCRSVREDGFTFDYSGHLLHMKRPEIRQLVFELVGEATFLKIDRRSGIYSHGTYTEYPFQVNTHGLPRKVVRACVMGFLETLQTRREARGDASFHDWALATFGAGVCRHFMFPYNRKLFCTELESLTADWVSWSIPKPTWADVVLGAQGTNRRVFGYNPSFYYPAAGGIDCLPRAFLPRIGPLRLSTEVTKVRAKEHVATLSSGESVRYSMMVSTMPLPALIARIDDAGADLKRLGQLLRCVSVLNLNLGFDAPCPRPYHWVYFPEAAFPFYRVGIYSNLCPASVPPGASSFYVEISHRPEDVPDVSRLIEQSGDALRRLGFVPPGARLCRTRVMRIPYAYVIHDRHRQSSLRTIKRYLDSVGILSVGRYGAWEYSAMEEALWHGREAALRIERAL